MVLIRNFCHWQWKIVNIRIVHLCFSPYVQCKRRAVRDAESAYLEPESFLTNSSRCVCQFQLWEMHWELGEKEAVMSWNNALPWISIHVFPSLSVFFVIAQAWVPRSGQRTMSRCDVSHVWTKAAWSWGASFLFLFPTGVTWGERQQNYKMRGPVWPGWDFMFIEKWVLIWKIIGDLLARHSLALPD